MLSRLLERFITGQDEYHKVLARCESPIERQFCQAAYPHLSVYGKLESQVWLCDYRVDFLLHQIKAAPRLKVVIEIDGHDYHSSPEQRDQDTERDRVLSRAGYQIVRFTGRQVRRSAQGCAKEAVELLQNCIKCWR